MNGPASDPEEGAGPEASLIARLANAHAGMPDGAWTAEELARLNWRMAEQQDRD